LETTEKGGTYEVKEPFEYYDCEGKVWTLERDKDYGLYYSVSNGAKKSTVSEYITVNIRACGPFLVFSLSISDDSAKE